jgi:hypothetical protein
MKILKSFDIWHNENSFSQIIHSEIVQEYINTDLSENTSATGGLSIGGMGAVVSANPSSFAGATIGTSYSSGGGTVGSDLSVPYNAGGQRVLQKIATPEMGKNHGAHTGKKSREKKLDMKTLKSMFAKRQDYTAGEGDSKRPTKVMSFDSFAKDDINMVKKESFGMNRENCDRCGKPTDGKTTMSIFNEDVICMSCKTEEKNDPDYDAASRAEAQAVRNGDHNFKGVYPDYKPIIRK